MDHVSFMEENPNGNKKEQEEEAAALRTSPVAMSDKTSPSSATPSSVSPSQPLPSTSQHINKPYSKRPCPKCGRLMLEHELIAHLTVSN
jgi:hypothetical protein